MRHKLNHTDRTTLLRKKAHSHKVGVSLALLAFAMPILDGCAAGHAAAPVAMPNGFSGSSPASTARTTTSAASDPIVGLPANGAPLAGTNGQSAVTGPYSVSAPTGAMAADAVGPLDVLAVEVFGIPELSRTTEVDGSGNIQLALIGALQVIGLTPEQIADRIEGGYRHGYVVDPTVNVRVVQRQSRLVTVVGAVARPGVYPMVGATTLMQALAMGGGVAENESNGDMRVLRRTNNGDVALAYNANQIRAGLAADPYILPGDRIVVDNNPRLVTVFGYVSKPGVYPYGGNMTLTQALALGSGPIAGSDPHSVRIVRRVGATDVATEHDLNAILANRVADPAILPGDRVVVAGMLQGITIDGAVGEPKVIGWQEGLTLTRGLAQARGLSSVADRSDIVVLRLVDGQLAAARFDIAQINNGTTQDPLLQPDDRVIVGQSAIRAFSRDFGQLSSLLNVFAIVATRKN